MSGDTATIIGDNKAFVYNAKDANDAGRPFVTLFPGDRFDLAARRVAHRAASDAPFDVAYIDSLFARDADPSLGGATVLVAQRGEVYVDKSYGIPAQPKYMPTTALPQFRLGGVQEPIAQLCARFREPPPRGPESPGAAPQSAMARWVSRLGPLVGWRRTAAEGSGDGQVLSSVDELYRFELRLEDFRAAARDSTARAGFMSGWTVDEYHGVPRLVAYGTREGKRNAFVNIPDYEATIIVLTNDDALDARAIADRITERLLSGKRDKH